MSPTSSPFPAAPLAWHESSGPALPRAGCAVAEFGDRIVAAGGTYWVEGRKYWCDRVDCLSPGTGRWEAGPSLPSIRGDGPAVVAGERLLLLGGGVETQALASVVSFDGHGWRDVPELTLPEPRRSSAVAVVKGVIYLVGGLLGSGTEFDRITGTVWASRPAGGWQPCAPLPAPWRFGAAVAVVGGRILVAGGCTPLGNGAVRNLDSVLSYDPVADRWAEIGRLPEARRGASGLALGERLLVIGGYSDRFLCDVLDFDPVQGQARPAAPLPVALADARFLARGGRIVGVTGENGVKMRYAGQLEGLIRTA